MKKGLLLIPFAALVLSGCALPSIGPGGGKKSSSQSSSETPASSSETPASSEVPSSSSSTPSSSTPAQEKVTLTFDFGTDFADYKSSFPYVDSDTGVDTEKSLGDLPIVSNGCYVSSFSGTGMLMMKNKERTTLAFIGNREDLVAITKVEFTKGASASASATYDISFGHSMFEAASSAGTSIGSDGGSATAKASDRYGYFAISATNAKVNGQIGTLTISYTTNPDAEGGGEEDTSSSTPVGPSVISIDVPTGDDEHDGYRKVLAAPENDKEYIYGIYQGNVDKYIFLNGYHHVDEKGEYPFYLTTTEDVSKAVKVKCHYVDATHYTIQVIGGGEFDYYDGKYLEAYVGTKTGTTQEITSIRLADNSDALWYFMETYNNGTAELEMYANFMDVDWKGNPQPVTVGTYDEYQTFSAVAPIHFETNFIAHLWEKI